MTMIDVPTVSIVEDDATVRDSLSQLIRRMNLHVRGYESVTSFLSGFDATRPGCVLLDIVMPDRDGIELMEHLHREHQSVPIIAMSGNATIPLSVQSMKLGAIEFLEKPIRFAALRDSIERAIRKDSRNRADDRQDTSLPILTTAEMLRLEHLMAEDYGILPLQVMECAGRSLAQVVARKTPLGHVRDLKIVVLAGANRHGGAALAAARNLHQWGARVQVISDRAQGEFVDMERHQLKVAERCGVPASLQMAPGLLSAPDVVVDGLMSIEEPRGATGRLAELIVWANQQPCPRVALEAPAGLCADTGTASEPTLRASATLSLALPKLGVTASKAAPFVGELLVADIGAPLKLLRSMAVHSPPALFARGEVIAYARK